MIAAPTPASPSAPQAPPRFAAAAHAFRLFFDELAGQFLERDRLLEQLQLALISREHLLVFGPPGTAKSQLALATMRRIVDAESGAASVFSKQIAETTVQSDLVGPVDFRVLTRTGRTEHLTDEGILGAVHGILDEVFDGREMLLRSILNLLEEREHKSGHKTTRGRTECTVMTSNRYLSEVVQRSPELMLAFADRISYVCFVPKGFARPASRAEMMRRAALRERPDLRCPLTIQDLDALQEEAEAVHLPSEVLEALEQLADELERALVGAAQATASYRPTKYFSNRTLVRSIKALKAAVALDATRRPRAWPLEATFSDLGALESFFALGGPSAQECETHLQRATDLRERAQLEAIGLEAKLFGQCLGRAVAGVAGGAEREALARELDPALKAGERAAESLRRAARSASADALGEAAVTMRGLAALLRPPPRYGENRRAVERAMEALLVAASERISSLEVPAEALPKALAAAHGLVQAAAAHPGLAAASAALLDDAMAAAALALEGLADARKAARFDPSRRPSLEEIEADARWLAEHLEALETAVADLATRPEVSFEALRKAAEAGREARGACADALLQALRLGPLSPYRSAHRDDRLLTLRSLAGTIARLETTLATVHPAAPAIREAISPDAWARLLWQEVGDFDSIARLHEQLPLALATLELPWPLAGRLLGAELPPRLASTCAETARGLRRPQVVPDAPAPAFEALLALEAVARRGEVRELSVLRSRLGLCGPDADWEAARHAASALDLARLEALCAFFEAWLEPLGGTRPESPRELEASAAGAALQRVWESGLPKVLYEERLLTRALARLDELRAAGVGDAVALRERLAGLVCGAVRFCEVLLECAGR